MFICPFCLKSSFVVYYVYASFLNEFEALTVTMSNGFSVCLPFFCAYVL